MKDDKLLELAIRTAILAGEEILEIYKEDDFGVEQKVDDTPITRADKTAHNVIVEQLTETQIPIISEEGKLTDYKERKQWKQFWLVDPLDGTKEFIKKNGEFTVNIALIQENIAVLGVIYMPVLGELYYGKLSEGAVKALVRNGEITEERNLPIEQKKRKKCVVVASRSFKDAKTEQYISKIPQEVELVSRGSSLKLCMIAEGTADVYPRFVNLKEWDIAAGVAIVEAAGKTVLNIETNRKVVFNSESLKAPYFIAKNK